MIPFRLLSLFLLTGLARAAAAGPAPMNVLFISIDDLRTEVRAFGSARALTPNLDRFAARAVKFDRAYCQYPLCNPSRAAVLTGRYPGTLKLYGNRDWFQPVRLGAAPVAFSPRQHPWSR